MNIPPEDQGEAEGACWHWHDHHGWPVLTIGDYQKARATLAPSQVRAMLDFLAVRSPEIVMSEYQAIYDEMERRADLEEKAEAGG